MRRSFWTHTVATVFALTMMAGQASAAPFSSISYTVTGGTFNGAYLTGPVTGGTLVYTLQSGYYAVSHCPGSCLPATMFLSLRNNSQTFTARLTLKSLTVNTLVFAAADGTVGIPPISGMSGGAALFAVHFTASAITGSGSGHVAGQAGIVTGPAFSFTHIFFIGSEVRTLVPEPGTATLLGLGLLGLGCVAGGGGVTARALRRRRE